MPSAATTPKFYLRGLGFLAILSSPLWVYSLFFAGSYEYGTSLMLVPLWLLLNIAAAVQVSRRDPFLRQNLLTALLVKIAASGLYLFMLFHIYEGGDAMLYFNQACVYAEDFAVRGEFARMDRFWGTNFIYLVTTWLVIIFGKAFPFFVVVFATISFWGEYLAYRAFCIAMPDGDHGLAGLLMFFLPSIVFWPATLGKDALIFFFIALSCYGFAVILRSSGPRAYPALALGLTGVLLVRPHVAAMIGMAVTVPYAFARNRTGIAGLLVKMLCVPLLIAGSYYLAIQATDFLAIQKASSTTAVMERISKNTYQGGSAFGGEKTLEGRLVMAPFLLFRPFPWEVHNPQSGIAAAEGLLLLWLLYRRRKIVFGALRHLFSSAFLMFIVVYFLEFSFAYGAVSTNFGVLTRERVMLLPYAAMLLCAAALVQPQVVSRPVSTLVAPMVHQRTTGAGV